MEVDAKDVSDMLPSSSAEKERTTITMPEAFLDTNGTESNLESSARLKMSEPTSSGTVGVAGDDPWEIKYAKGFNGKSNLNEESGPGPTSTSNERNDDNSEAEASSSGIGTTVDSQESIKIEPVDCPTMVTHDNGTTTIQSESISYGSGAKAGDVVLRYNCQDSSYWEQRKETGMKWSVNKNPLNGPVLTSASKYMFQQTRDVASFMNDIVLELGSAITTSYSLGPAANLQESSTEDVYVGRICSSIGKLSPTSVLLEGTLESSSGHVISLDLSHVEDYFLFPGQVIGLRGMNAQGRCIQVSKLFIPRPLPLREGQISINTATGPLSILIAAGPFTPKNSLEFEPFMTFLSVLTKTKPDICFLLGPFLDSAHPMACDEKQPLKESFLKIFSKRLTDLVKTVNGFERPTQIVMVSSWKEAHHAPVFPTIPYMTKEFPSIISIPDPGTVSIGGLLFTATSTDILMHLSRNEVANSTKVSDRMGRLANHLLSQRNLYPLYPPDESVPLDAELWTEYSQMFASPHVLILPSDLRHFIKDVDGTLVVNPERLTKGNCGGTYARLLIDLPNEPDDITGVGDGSPITGFVAGEILKI